MVLIKDGEETFDIKDISTVNELDAGKDPNGIYLNYDKKTIPDLNNLTTEIIKFLEYINTDEMEQMEIENYDNYKKIVEVKFPDLALNYIHIFNMLLKKEGREDNLAKLLNLFDILKDVKNGKKDMKEEFDKFKEEQASKYIYPKYGSKQKFEKYIRKRALKKQNKKK